MKLYYKIRTADDQIYVESGEVAAMPPFQVGQLIEVNAKISKMRIANIEWSLYTTENLEEDGGWGTNPEPQLCASVLVEKA